MDNPKPDLTEPTIPAEDHEPLNYDLPTSPTDTKKKYRSKLPIIVLLVLALIAGVGYYIYSNHKYPQAAKAETTAKSTSKSFSR